MPRADFLYCLEQNSKLMLALEETIFYFAVRVTHLAPQDGVIAYAIYRALAALPGATD
jgi:hypothetical protein